MKQFYSHLSLGLTAGALFFSGCGKPADDAASANSEPEAPAQLVIPEAPDEAIQLIISELAGGNGGIVWKAMPETYQVDINKVAQLAGSKIDAEMYDKTFDLINRIGSVATKQKDFLLNSTMIPVGDPVQKEQMAQSIPAVAQVLELIATSDLGTSAGLKAFEGQKFFDSTVSELIELIEKMPAVDSDELSLEALRNAVVAVVEQTDTTAKLSLTAAGDEEIQDFVKVENRWVPVDLANDWTSSIAQAISELEAIKPEEVAAQKPQMMSVFTMLDGVLTQLDSAESQEQFDQAIQGAMMPMMGMMMMFQGMGGEGGMPAPGLPTAP